MVTPKNLFVSNEQPPITTTPELREWLARQTVLINAALRNVQAIETVSAIPANPESDKIYFFDTVILPNIDAVGPWVYINGNWCRLIDKDRDIEIDLVLEAVSTVTQTPAGTDNPMQITFGAAVGTPTDPVQILANGDLVFNEDNDYDIIVSLTCMKTNSATSTIFLAYTEINGFNAPRSTLLELDDQRSEDILRVNTFYKATSGDVIKIYILKDSTGDSNGSLAPFTPALAGVPPSPSALIQVISRKVS